MRFDVISLFPEILDPYFDASILGRAKESNLVEILTHQLRDFSLNKHHTVDDTPYGGGAGMVLSVEPIAEAVKYVQSLVQGKKSRSILFSAKGRLFTQEDARRLALYDSLILICGRYEGVDERVSECVVDEELSIGHYVLTGGEIPALVVVDAVARLIPGVLGNTESAITESHTVLGTLEYPQYTRPETWEGKTVPSILLSGDHANIALWRRQNERDATFGDASKKQSSHE